MIEIVEQMLLKIQLRHLSYKKREQRQKNYMILDYMKFYRRSTDKVLSYANLENYADSKHEPDMIYSSRDRYEFFRKCLSCVLS
jgi:hypothetical protein